MNEKKRRAITLLSVLTVMIAFLLPQLWLWLLQSITQKWLTMSLPGISNLWVGFIGQMMESI